MPNIASSIKAKVLITGPYESAGSQIAMLDTTSILKNANDAIDDGNSLIG